MPYSHDAPKPWCLARIAELAPEHVLDVGPGAGGWAHLLRGPGLHLDCIEAHGPYVERFGLGALYSNVFLGDVRQWDWGGSDYVTVAESPDPIGEGTPKWTWDLVILGDVLEHMTKEEALAVVDQALGHAEAVLVVIPTGEWPQGESEGNPLEAHVSTWMLPDLDDIPKTVGGSTWILSDDQQISALLLGVWPKR